MKELNEERYHLEYFFKQIVPNETPPDRITVVDGTVYVLRIRNDFAGIEWIVNALTNIGYRTNAKNTMESVRATLSAEIQKENSRIIRVMGQYGLPGWESDKEKMKKFQNPKHPRVGMKGNASVTRNIADKVIRESNRRVEGTVRDNLRYRFFAVLLERTRTRTQLFANVKPSGRSYLAAGAGVPGITFNYDILKHSARIALYIGTDDARKNRHVFEALVSNRESIENGFGGPLEWLPNEELKSCRIQKTYSTGGYRDEGTKLEEAAEELVDAMARFESVMGRYLKRL